MSTNEEDRDNEVRLRGTVSGDAEVRVLPSGDELCLVRVVVPRATVRVRPDGRRGQSVDVIDCAAWEGRPRRSMRTWRDGDAVEVAGALRRRFFRAGGATASRVEVEVSSAKVLRRSVVVE